MSTTIEVTCSRCGAAKEPELVEGKRRCLPRGWLQVQTTDDVGRVRNVVLCAIDAAPMRRAMLHDLSRTAHVT